MLFCARFFFLKSTNAKLDVQRDILKMNEKKKEEKAQELSNVKDFNTESKINQEYEQQYDPNNDFAIFGIGNTAMGGIQDMKEKMNMADKPEG